MTPAEHSPSAPSRLSRRTALSVGFAATAGVLGACDSTNGPTAGKESAGDRAPSGPNTAGSEGKGAGASAGPQDPNPTSQAGVDLEEQKKRDAVKAELKGKSVDDIARSLSPRDAAAQHIFIAVPQGSNPDLGTTVGGFFLLERWHSDTEIHSALTTINNAGFPIAPIAAVDQEGGQIRMLRSEAFPKTPSAQELGMGSPEAVHTAYSEMGAALHNAGIHLALAPVADTVDPELGKKNAPVGALKRGFGTEPDHVAACVSSAVSALNAAGVQATLKHFPGLGRVANNTDHSANDITDPTTAPGDPFLDPFTAGINAGASTVMLSSAVYPKIDGDNPAMFSRAVVTDLLRGELGFTKVAMTDDIGAAKAVQDIPVKERVRKFLAAGGDIAISADPGLAEKMVDAAQKCRERNPREAHASLVRILELKKECGLLH